MIDYRKVKTLFSDSNLLATDRGMEYWYSVEDIKHAQSSEGTLIWNRAFLITYVQVLRVVGIHCRTYQHSLPFSTSLLPVK